MELPRRPHLQPLMGKVLVVILEPMEQLLHDLQPIGTGMKRLIIAFDGFYKRFRCFLDSGSGFVRLGTLVERPNKTFILVRVPGQSFSIGARPGWR